MTTSTMIHIHEFKIEKNIPIASRAGKSKYPFAEMEIGDSFSVPDRIAIRVRSSMSTYQTKNNKKFLLINCGNEYRCWRKA